MKTMIKIIILEEFINNFQMSFVGLYDITSSLRNEYECQSWIQSIL